MPKHTYRQLVLPIFLSAWVLSTWLTQPWTPDIILLDFRGSETLYLQDAEARHWDSDNPVLLQHVGDRGSSVSTLRLAFPNPFPLTIRRYHSRGTGNHDDYWVCSAHDFLICTAICSLRCTAGLVDHDGAVIGLCNPGCSRRNSVLMGDLSVSHDERLLSISFLFPIGYLKNTA